MEKYKLMKLNLCCGYDIKDDYDNYDIKPVDDKVRFLDCNILPLPFKSESCKEIILNQGLEHLNINQLDFMNDINRILIKDGIINIGLPVYSPFIYHKTFNHTKGYFNPIIIKKNAKEKYNIGSFELLNVIYKRRSFKGIIYYLIDSYRRLTKESVCFKLIKKD